MASTMISIPGYPVIEEIYNGSRTLVYRCVRETDSLPVVIKLLKNPYPGFSELLSFRNQYTITKNIKSSLIVQTYGLEPYENGYLLVMEDFGGISLKQWRVRETQQSLQQFLEIAIALCKTLDILYRERVIHKDIKPSNILINPETKQVKLIDFSIASLLPRETQTLVNPNVLEGTLAYISPEQTGRMNRGIDYRTDFYSLGVTFYELLTGELPFSSNDPMELVHCHIAKAPKLVHEINPQIPVVLSQIVGKLMAKNAEDRYQSALGLKYDVEKCLTQLRETGEIQNFEIATRDVCDRFLIREKLYGREQEVQTLLEAFGRVANKATELMLVTGFSGIGKTAVVNEVHKPIVKQRGYFIKGKFDQFNRNIPFSAFVQAFRDLMRQLLSESDTQLEQWQSKILQAVGDSGQVLIEVIPELEQIIGKQPPAPELSGSAVQNRFNRLFQQFIGVFTTIEHPLVIFLDDLQWADSASLNLMQVLLNRTEQSYLFIIGAYRDNEVLQAHPLIQTLQEITKAGAIVNTVKLGALSETHINCLIADTLNCGIDAAQPLTELVYQKAKGNPFFTTQFLNALYKDELITFDWSAGCWQCDIAKVKALSLTDDVVEFMVVQLQKLPEQTQRMLKLAACMGAQFDLETLAIISEQSATETAIALWKALQEGFVIPTNEIYKFYQTETASGQPSAAVDTCIYRFLHDRVQQAAYCLIPEEQRQIVHLKIGRILLKNTAAADIENKIFTILNQINYGVNLLQEESEREFIARLNLQAGQKAKSATAYDASLKYLYTAKSLLADDCWDTKYDLTHHLYTTIADVEYLNGNYKQAEELVDFTLQKSTSKLDRAIVYRIKLQLHTALLQFTEAINVGLACLQELEINLEPHPPEKQQLQVDFLINLPRMTDPCKEAGMEVLNALISPAYVKQPELLAQIINTMLHVSIRHGNSPFSTYAYSLYGMVLCAFMGDVDQAYQMGEMAMELVEKLDAKTQKTKVLNMFGNHIRHWRKPAQDDLELNLGLQGFYCGLETGDLENAQYSIIHYCNALFFLGLSLPDVEQKFTDYTQILKHLNIEYGCNYLNQCFRVILALQRNDFDLSDFSEYLQQNEQIESDLAANQIRTVLFMFYVFNTLFLYILGRNQQALNYATKAAPLVSNAPALITGTQQNFYHSLALLAEYPNVDSSQQAEFLKIVDENQQKMKIWANNAPENFLHQYELVEAEKATRLGQTLQAVEYYDRAISGAKKNGYTHDEALANELTAKFYLAWHKDRIAQEYLIDAYYGYARWGAKVKVADLEHRYPQLLKPILEQRQIILNPWETITSIAVTRASKSGESSSSSGSISNALDFTSVLKAAQTISSNIEFDELITSLTKIILENAGAKKSVLILPQENIWQVRAITLINHQDNSSEKTYTILEPQLLDSCQDVPIKIINYVKNTQETLVIENCQTDIPGILGEYMDRIQPKSILCTPILNQGQLVGIIYLENRLTGGVFTPERLQVINLLSSQAAIALENARLYQQAQQALEDLQQAQLQIVQSEKMSALGNLVAGVAHEMNNPLGFIAATLQQTKPTIADLSEHIRLYQEVIPNPGDEIIEHAEEIDLDYSLEDLPKMLDAMVMACDRLKNISTSLRTFSRADKDYKVPFNIHEGIDSTILILKHRLKANEQRPAIEVITEYGDLPQIECFPGQLNQVFMNILANAIDALDESNTGKSFAEIQAHPNRIQITTSIEDKYFKISIADNGKGMNESVKQKIFDHLFTTKGVGKGTGLGLAIAKQIVEETHGGKLSCHSILGKGTEFMIEIPA